jgi:predicted DCC family thiol-disulfide oxidoreductase YuxK
MPDPANPILLYDGVCGLCNRLVQFVLKRDASGHFRFAPLQSDFASRILRQHGLDPDDLDTVYLVEQPGQHVTARSDAVISVLRKLGGLWPAAALLLRALPKSLRDWGYDIIARNRYRIFGKHDICPLPEEKYQHRFLDS